jgi:hypothetical protein
VAALIVDRIIRQDRFRTPTGYSSGNKVDPAKDLGPVTKWDIRQISDLITKGAD